MRTGSRADQVIGVVDIGDPVAQRLVHRILQRAAAGRHRLDLGAEQLHAEHVRRLALDVGRAHIDDAGKAEAGSNRRRRHAMLAGAGFGDDAGLAHALGQQDLADAIVDLVRTGVVQLFALEIDLGAAEFGRQALGEIERARAADIMGAEMLQFRLEFRIGLGLVPLVLQVEDQRHQGFGNETAAENAEATVLVGAGLETNSGLASRSLASPCQCRFRPISASARATASKNSSMRLQILDARRAFDAGRSIDGLGAWSAPAPQPILSVFKPPESM